MSIDLNDWSTLDFSTGLAGGILSVLMVAFAGRYFAASFTKVENRNLVGFCLALGMFLGQGSVVSGSPRPDDIELFGRAIGSLLMLTGFWFFWFKKPMYSEDS